MTRRSLICAALGGALLALPWPATADEKDRPATSGSWARKEGELRLEFADKGVLKILPHGDKVAITIVCSYTAAKDGVVKAKVTDLEGKAEVTETVKGHVPVGTEFSFEWKVKAGTATLGDVKGDKADALKSHLEGEYEKK
jgi:hypothetical protein